MELLKSIIEFLRTKFGTFVNKNTTVEDQYIKAGNTILNEIQKLQTRWVTAGREITEKHRQAKEKDELAAQKERQIKFALGQNSSADVTLDAKLGLLYRRTATALRGKADELAEMRSEIEGTVVQLDDERNKIKSALEFIKATKDVDSLGLDSMADVIESAGLTKVDVEATLRRIDTFNTKPAGIETTSADVAEYLESLK